MNKISYKNLTIEITRRCNMSCAHCCRGDAQSKDMSYETIDAFLNNADIIYRLAFTGGEPTLNIDGMRYFLESCKRNKVVILGLAFVTNATVRSKELVGLMKDYAEYIGHYITVEPKLAISIDVSTDIFHGEESKVGYEWYKENLSDYATVKEHRAGNVPYNLGRAIELGYAMFVKEFPAVQIHYKTNEHEPLCLEKNSIPLIYPEQIVILCHMRLSVDGLMMDSHVNMMDYERIDLTSPIWDVHSVHESGEIIDAIEKYNEDKPHCTIKDDSDMVVDKNKISPYGEAMIDLWLKHLGMDVGKDSVTFAFFIILHNALERHPNPVNYAKDLIAYTSNIIANEGYVEEATKLVALVKAFMDIHSDNDDSLEDYTKRWNAIRGINTIEDKSILKAITEKIEAQKLSRGEKAEIIKAAKIAYLHRKHGDIAKHIEENYSEQYLLEYFEIAKNIDDIMEKIYLADSVESIEQLEIMLKEAQQREREFLVSHNVG